MYTDLKTSYQESIEQLNLALKLIITEVAQSKTSSIELQLIKDVTFLTLTRILLAEQWRKYGLIDGSKPLPTNYESYHHQIANVLNDSFYQIPINASPLFGQTSYYSWYSPSHNLISKVIEIFSNVDLSTFRIDALGMLYEKYLDPRHRMSTGQFYTPPEVISFIWNRLGLKQRKDFFRITNGKAEPIRIMDPTAGSGSFLIEAARRLTDNVDAEPISLEELLAIANVLASMRGYEVQTFPNYLTQFNLLIQMTPIIRKIMKNRSNNKENWLPVILQKNSLGSLECVDQFDIVCSNPPFIGEKGNRRLFQDTIGKYPYWKQYYQAKMDYFYWFLILGLSKLKEGGKLGFITTSYWPTADGAATLREFVLKHALIREIIDFGDTTIFPRAPGQHSMIIILERSSDSAKRANNNYTVAKVKTNRNGLVHVLECLNERMDEFDHSDDIVDIHQSTTVQGQLNSQPWHVFHHSQINRVIAKISEAGTRLGDLFHISQGIISGADTVNQRNIRLLPGNTVNRFDIKPGDGIFVLRKHELENMHLSEDEMSLIKPCCKNSDIKPYRLNSSLDHFLIYTDRNTNIRKYPNIYDHLQKFRSILKNKRECKQQKLPWYSLHWPRNLQIFRNTKIVTPNRAHQNTFALSKIPHYGMSDVFFITEYDRQENLGYILALLNSSLLNFWFAHVEKRKGQSREYVGRPLSNIPVRHIDFNIPREAAVHDRLVALSEDMAVKSDEDSRLIQEEINYEVLKLYGLNASDLETSL